MTTGPDVYERVRSDGAVVPRADRRLLRLTGPQNVWFLQNTITADVDDLADGTWVESCFLEPKGHVLAHFRVGRHRDELWLDVDPPSDDLVDWFVRYRFRTKVEIEDRSTGAFTVLGPRAAAMAGPGELRVDGSAVIFGDTLGDVPLADVHAPAEPAALSGLPRGDHSLYEVLRLEAGLPRFGADYGPRDLPQEAGLTRVVSAEKGCYVGQEVVARLHFRGHVNKVLRPLVFEGVSDPVGRQLLADGSRVGVVTSAAVSPGRGLVGIGMVRVEPPAGSEVAVEGGGTAVVGAIPEGTKIKTS